MTKEYLMGYLWGLLQKYGSKALLVDVIKAELKSAKMEISLSVKK